MSYPFLPPQWFLYLARCRDNSLYCGITTNLVKRIKEHNAGTGAKYTASRRPVTLVYSERHPNLSSAMKREVAVKTLTKNRKEQLAAAGVSAVNLDDLSSSDPKVKYACAKRILAVGKANPADLYPRLDFFIKLLDSDNRILKWTAIDTLGYLARVDTIDSIDRFAGRLFEFLNTGNMITANHAIAAIAEIALAKPEYKPRVVDALLKVEKYSYETGECRNIAVGKVIVALGSLINSLREPDRIIGFVRRQTRNSRPATQKKAEQFLKRIPS